MGLLDNLLDTVAPETVDKMIDKGLAMAETSGRKRLPDAGILAGAGILMLLLSGILFYWGKLR
jgi:hypothetical protein